MTDRIALLIAGFGEQSVLYGDALAARCSGFYDSSPVKALALLRPGSTAEVAAMLRMCNDLGQPVTPFGGLTNLVHNALTEEKDVALSLERMNAVEEIDCVGGTMVVQAGATLQQVQEAAAQAGMFFPLDLAARSSATVGGTIATNAGGVRVIRLWHDA